MDFNKVVRQRRSVRQYAENKQITKEQLEKILLAGMAAPVSHKDYESIQITVVQDKALLEEIKNAFGSKQDPLYGVPTLLIISTKSAKVPTIEYLNAAGIIENMLLAATELGLGSIYLTAILSKIADQSKLLEILEIPEEHKMVGAVGVGYKLEMTQVESDEIIRSRIHVVRK